MERDIHRSVGRGGKNRGPDVDTVVHLLNLHRRRSGLAPLKPQRKCNDAVISAIEEYQRSKGEVSTGLLEANGTTISVLKTPLETYAAMEYTDPEWLKIACSEKRKRSERSVASRTTTPTFSNTCARHRVLRNCGMTVATIQTTTR